MSTPSSLYAEKIFSEHPVAFWPLDDKADYVSLISETNRDLRLWNINNGTAENIPSILDEPFPESYVTKITAQSSSENVVVSAVSPNLINFSSISKTLATFAIGSFVYTDSSYISGFEIGYQYFDESSGSLVEKTKLYPTSINGSWTFISETFNVPTDNVSARLVVKARFFEGDIPSNYSFLVNGVSFGQWSEEFNATSLGVVPVEIPENIFNARNLFGIEAKSYGLQNLNGYYMVRRNSLAAKNSGVPMVFGAANSTILQRGPGILPSLIIPGQGFLNDSGKYKDYTFEFWLRINSDSTEEKRIFGNIRGNDGLYVNGPILTLKVGDNIIRHYVGEWYRPMLIQIRYSASSISLVINGEQVGELFVNIDSLNFPSKITKVTTITPPIVLDNDWLGFWTYEEVMPIEIDGVAIYSYKVPIQVAKRRFIYGQGVEFPENINNAYSGSSIFIDFPFSKYAKNYSYPNLGRWRQGVYDNLSINGNAIEFPNYTLPEVKFSNKSSNEWITDLEQAQNEDSPFIRFRPNSSWDSTNGQLFFENVSIANETIKGFYVVCKEMSMPLSEQTLITIESRTSGNIFEISLDQEAINYRLFENGISSLLVSKPRQYLSGVGEKNVVGIDIQKFSDYYGGKAAEFFGNLTTFSVYLGSKKDLSSMFLGNVYDIGFCSSKNLRNISSIFAIDGLSFTDNFIDGSLPHLYLADAEEDVTENAIFEFLLDGGTLGQYSYSVLEDHVPSYGISPGESLSGFNLLIKANSSWQDYIPLSFFAKDSFDARGDSRLDLDFIQFNINYPAPSIFIQETEEGAWTYAELQSEYSNPIQRTYESLDNQLFTGFENYEDLKNKSVSSYKYDTSSSIVKTYVTFQLLESGANLPSTAFTNIELAPKNGIIVPASNWINTKYEVVDNMIIYPPQSISFDKLAIVTHIEISSKSIKDTPISIKSLQYASMSLSDTSPTAIGTRFGNDVYPFRKDGFYFNYKGQNAFSIYKGSSPYLYLTRNSGITVRGNYDPAVNRGISVPINNAKADNFKVIAMQMAIRFDQDFFPYGPIKLFEIQSKNSYIRVYAVASHPSGKRAKIYAINSRGQLENGLAFYLNGKLVKDATLTVKEWSMLGIRFANTQEFSGYAGAIRLTAPLTYNNLSYYKSTNLQEVSDEVKRPWFKVKTLGPLTLNWVFWPSYLWDGVLYISKTSYYGVDPSDIYKIYTGTNKIIIDDEIETVFGDYKYTLAENISWQSQVYQAV
jgi:hypothetical protein